MYHIVPEVRFSIYITVHRVCHGVVRLVSSNGYILFPRPLGRIYRRFIIIIITMTPFDVGGREVGRPTIYEGYMVWYIVGF